MMRKMFRDMRLELAAEDTGGSFARTISLNLQTGMVSVYANGERRVLWQASAVPPCAAQ